MNARVVLAFALVVGLNAGACTNDDGGNPPMTSESGCVSFTFLRDHWNASQAQLTELGGTQRWVERMTQALDSVAAVDAELGDDVDEIRSAYFGGSGTLDLTSLSAAERALNTASRNRCGFPVTGG